MSPPEQVLFSLIGKSANLTMLTNDVMSFQRIAYVKLPKKFKYAGQRLTYDHKHRHAIDQGGL